jgi:hypothetical protein
MSEQGLICDWHDKYRSLWGHQPIRFGHRLHTLDLFSADGLAGLIESYPREHFSIVQTNDNTQDVTGEKASLEDSRAAR